jgi:CheY-like chemotaxis protein
MKHVLVLEPDRLFASSLRRVFEKENLAVTLATTTEEAMDAADKRTPDVVISEISLRGHSGSEFLYELKSYDDWQHIPLVIYSSIQVPETMQKSKDFALLEVAACLYKPHDSLQDLVSVVQDLISK